MDKEWESASVLSDIKEKEGTRVYIGKKTNHKTLRGYIGRSKPWDTIAFRIDVWCDVNFCLCMEDSPQYTLINTSKKILISRAWQLFINIWRLGCYRSKNVCVKCKCPHIVRIHFTSKQMISSEDPNFSKWGCKYANWRDFGRTELLYIRKRMKREKKRDLGCWGRLNKLHRDPG